MTSNDGRASHVTKQSSVVTETPLSEWSIWLSQHEDLLALVHEELEGGANADRIKEIVTENPTARDAIYAFAAAWFGALDDGDAE